MPFLIIGKHKATTIKIAYKSLDILLQNSDVSVATVIIVKYKIEPKQMEIKEFLNDLLPNTVSPIKMLAKPTTKKPVALDVSKSVLTCANNDPAKPMSALLMETHTMVVTVVLIPWDLAILSLTPVALIAIPYSVPKKK